MKWTQAEAITLAGQIEALAPEFGCHVALTGGTLYKMGERKDADFLFYRIRQVEKIDREGLLLALQARFGMQMRERKGWVQKAVLEGRSIDLFFPECEEVWDENNSRQTY